MKFSAISLALIASALAGLVNAAPMSESSVLLAKRAPSCYGSGSNIVLTQYWIPVEGHTDMDNNGNIVSLTGAATKALKDDNGNTIAMVSPTTYDKCQMEGTCILKNGDVLNLAGSKNAFTVLDNSKYPYGQGSNGNPLSPYVSVAANDVSYGSTLYVKELDGLVLPGNAGTHNGCVRVDDQGWSFGGCQLDWFVVTYEDYVAVSNNLPDKVSATIKDCTVGNYTP